METLHTELSKYMELNPAADADELAWFIGDGMAMRFVEAFGARGRLSRALNNSTSFWR